ncbi:MAG: putative endonuclease 4 [Mycoplasmataceae bacterium]|nr:MAG: putative endonuclease 4 [Mycoplasmataceae bacterium]
MVSNDKDYNLIIGRHCPFKAPDYLSGAIEESLSYGANALMVYLGAPQNTYRKPLSELKITEFHQTLKKNNFSIDNIIIHGSYIVNLANITKKEMFSWSVDFLQKEINRMEEIGLKTIVIHPGSSVNASVEESLLQLIKGINLVLAKNSKIRIALETMSGRGSEIGKNFQQLKYIIDNIEKKKQVGVCWDTCHLYSAGYDIKSDLDAVIKEFERLIGLDKLWVIHVNDSLGELRSKVDRHENIGYGKIGLEALRKLIWHPKLNDIPKILETPRERDYFLKEIKVLKGEV